MSDGSTRLDDVQEHLPDFNALVKAHQNVIGGKVKPHEMKLFAVKPEKMFQLKEMMMCNDVLRKYMSTRSASDMFTYSFCLGSKVCPSEMDDWVSCFRENYNGDLTICARQKRAAERCTVAWAKDMARMVVDHDLYSSHR